jgi:hypothetical protein
MALIKRWHSCRHFDAAGRSMPAAALARSSGKDRCESLINSSQTAEMLRFVLCVL